MVCVHPPDHLPAARLALEDPVAEVILMGGGFETG